jgi:2-polyprenyl-3-methyl-5-hydroxy-6-metoxy-1,4-benzoquinol methylase
MPASRISKSEVGTPRYYELLQQEAEFWERTARGEMDISVATWRDAELTAATSGDLLARALDLVVARGPRVLELACADGALSMRLARRGCMCDGIDISTGLIEQGRQQIATLRSAENWLGHVHLRVDDLNRIELAPNAYDVVLAAAALHHVLDLEHLIGEIYKALKPGGTLVCLDHMGPAVASRVLRYLFLFVLPTEVPYRRKPVHVFNRLMARMYRRFLPQRPTPASFALPERSPFEEISGGEAVSYVRDRFVVETYQTHLAFADLVAGHLRLGSHAREVKMARLLRRLDDWLVTRLGVRGVTYYLVARKPSD